MGTQVSHLKGRGNITGRQHPHEQPPNQGWKTGHILGNI